MRAGARLCNQARVRRVERAAGGFRLETARGAVQAREVLVGTNGYTGPATPRLQRRVIPIGSYIIATAPLPPNYTSDQVVRAQCGDNIRAYLAANPGVILRVYSPSNGGDHTDGDCIWDSRVSDPYPWMTG